MSCPYDCYTCDSNGNCLSCNTTDFRILSTTKRCLAQDGYFDNSSQICVKCPTLCSKCNSLTVCTSCIGGQFLRPNNQCYGTCENGYYADNITNLCVTCVSGCQSCESSHICRVCGVGSFLLNNVCSAQCPPRYFANS